MSSAGHVYACPATGRKARLNVWGNWNGYEGSRKVKEFGPHESDARDWVFADELEQTQDIWPEEWRALGVWRVEHIFGEATYFHAPELSEGIK